MTVAEILELLSGIPSLISLVTSTIQAMEAAGSNTTTADQAAALTNAIGARHVADANWLAALQANGVIPTPAQ